MPMNVSAKLFWCGHFTFVGWLLLAAAFFRLWWSVFLLV
ncbi:hypothetical protein RHRU231_720037 [Rhodococcus ruber]|uniref:Uncharacterized protein n=1 Tax=Rhodococcus ruber TaxID=1830 RepID=A0A098BQM4_9NOCA|nr:hypothetical protein RHRU231_720037 [Rhodococcus ruber]